MEAVLAQLLSLPLLKQDPLEARGQALRQCQVSQSNLGCLNRKKICELSPWFENDQLPGTVLRRGLTKFGLIDEFTQLLRDGNMPQSRLVGSSLHRDGQEFSVVTFQVALQKCDHVACCAHSSIRGHRTASSFRDASFIIFGADGKRISISD